MKKSIMDLLFPRPRLVKTTIVEHRISKKDLFEWIGLDYEKHKSDLWGIDRATQDIFIKVREKEEE